MEQKFYNLRKKAEELLRNSKENKNSSFANNVTELLEELSVSQIELELQNLELRETQNKLQLEKEKFADLNQNAPVGYLQLNEKGNILSFNNRVAEIFAVPADLLLNRPFIAFIKKEYTTVFYTHLRQVFNPEISEANSEIVILNTHHEQRILRLKSNFQYSKFNMPAYCRTIIEDVTELKQQQQRILNLNNRLENSMIAGNMAWWEVELPSGNISFNKNKALMLGREVEDFKHYSDFTTLLHPADYEPTMEAFRQHITGKKQLYECDYRIRHKNGEYLWFRDIGKISSKNGDEIVLNGLVINITDHKKIEHEISLIHRRIEEERNTFLSLLDSISAYIYVCDANSNELLFANKALKEFFGNDIVGKICYEVLQNDTKICPFCPKINMKEDTPYYWEYFNPIMKKDFYVMDKYMKWTDNKHVHFQMATDISLLKHTERNLKETTNNLQVLVKNVPLAIFLHRPQNNGQIVLTNKTAAKYTGYTEDEILQLNVFDIDKLAEGRKGKDTIWQTLKFGELYKLESTHWRKDGSTYLAEINFSLVNYENELAVISIVQDVTERKNTEIAIQESRKKLQELNATKDKFFSIIAHDLKNPFNTILGFSELLEKNISTYDIEKIGKFVNFIHNSADSAYKLLENLLDWSRSQTNRIEFAPAHHNLFYIVEEARGVLADQAVKKEINITNSISPEQIIFADKNMLHTIVRNLISNAIKFTHKTGSIIIEAIENEMVTSISIKDNGIGMNQEIQNKLFDISTKNNRFGTDNEKGTGLGLLLCKEFIDQHAGCIEIISKENAGSIFTINFPIVKKIQ